LKIEATGEERIAVHALVGVGVPSRCDESVVDPTHVVIVFVVAHLHGALEHRGVEIGAIRAHVSTSSRPTSSGFNAALASSRSLSRRA